jgi:hypothetical protein
MLAVSLVGCETWSHLLPLLFFPGTSTAMALWDTSTQYNAMHMHVYANLGCVCMVDTALTSRHKTTEKQKSTLTKNSESVA